MFREQVANTHRVVSPRRPQTADALTQISQTRNKDKHTMSGGKRAASSELAEEPDAKAAKLDDSADAKEKPAELAEEAADQEGEDGDAAPTRRSSRARKAPAKGRDAPGKAAKGAEPKMVTVTYKEGDVLGEHLHAVGTLVEVKIPAESTVSGNQQVRRAIETRPFDARLERGRARDACVSTWIAPAGHAGGKTRTAATLELPDPPPHHDPRDRFARLLSRFS